MEANWPVRRKSVLALYGLWPSSSFEVPNTRYVRRNILTTVPGGGCSVMLWGCVSYDWKIDLITISGTVNAQRHRDGVLEPILMPHFDDHTLASRPIFMADNARTYRARSVVIICKAAPRNFAMASPKSWPQSHRASMGYYWPPSQTQWSTRPKSTRINAGD